MNCIARGSEFEEGLTLMLNNPINDTIIRIRSLMRTLQPFPSLIPRNPQRNPVLGA
jgi:hypothetical protein